MDKTVDTLETIIKLVEEKIPEYETLIMKDSRDNMNETMDALNTIIELVEEKIPEFGIPLFDDVVAKIFNAAEQLQHLLQPYKEILDDKPQ